MAEVLEIIEIATKQLSGEQYPTMSLVLPLVYGLRSQLASSDSDRRLVADFKATLREQLTRRFSPEKLHPSSLPLLNTEPSRETNSIQFSLTPAAQCRAGFEPCDERRPAKQKSPVLTAETAQPA